MVMAAFVGQHAFAGTCATTGISGPGTCTITFNADNPTGPFTFTGPDTVTVGTVDTATHIGIFTFNSTVHDARLGTAGWALAASTDGLTLGGTGTGANETADINFNGDTPSNGAGATTVTPATVDGGVCQTTSTVSALQPVPATAGTFISTGTVATGPVECDYTIAANGYVDFSGKVAGTYTGDVTITLSSI